MTGAVRGILWTVIVLAGINLVLPFIGPAIGFGMGPDPAFAITTSRVTRHVIPDLVVIVGAWLMLRATSATALYWGGLAAILAAGWVAVGPHVLAVESVSQLFRRITYHSLTGVILTGLAGIALGMLIAGRKAGMGVKSPTAVDSEKLGV